MLTTPIFGLIRPDSNDYADQLGDDMGATVDRIEQVLAGIGANPSAAVGGLAAEVAARQATDARVTALSPGAWTTPTITGAGAPVAGYQPARYRKLPALDSLQLAMVLSGPIVAGTILFTLPVGFRPIAHVTLPVLTSATTLGQLDVQSGGAVRCQSTVASGAFLGFAAMVPLS